MPYKPPTQPLRQPSRSERFRQRTAQQRTAASGRPQFAGRQEFERAEAYNRAQSVNPLGGSAYTDQLNAYLASLPQTPGENAYPAGGPGGGRGGGGRGGPNPAQIRAMADELFRMNTGPYDQMRAQANAYNPDFNAMTQQYSQLARGIESERAAEVRQRLDALAGFGNRLQAEAGAGTAGALRDLGAQGVNAQQYMQMAAQANAGTTGMLANQGQYLGQLNAQGANSLADYLRSSGLISQGGEATLANNRGQLLNQLAVQQAQEQQRLDQARREFMLQYGVV
jgi:hypothetical protein